MNKDKLEKKKHILLSFMNDPMYTPMKLKELAVFLDISKNNRNELIEVIDSLIDDGKIRKTKRGKYEISDEKALVGTFVKTKSGRSYVHIEGMDSIYIPSNKTLYAIDGDIVRVRVDIKGHIRNPEGRIIQIIKRSTDKIVGLYKIKRNLGIVMPDDARIDEEVHVISNGNNKPEQNDKVIVKIISYPNDSNRYFVGEIKEILGKVNEPGIDILSIIKRNDIETDLPSEVNKELDNISDHIDNKQLDKRLDLRDILTVTIDGEDAKDLDDAISLTREDNIWQLGVHIADVSEYVKEYSAIDRWALKRGTSIYPVDRVIPMLPAKLSNGICSLNEGMNRLTLSCMIDIDDKGNVISYKILPSIINVDKRMNYTTVNKVISYHDKSAMMEYDGFVDMLEDMYHLSQIIRNKRIKRGAIDFDIPEAKIILDNNGKPVDVKAYEHNNATDLIEDFMLMANETVAKEFNSKKIPFIYRVHPGPSPDKIDELSAFVGNFGYSIRKKDGEITPLSIQKLMNDIDGTDESILIRSIALRAMSKAIYDISCDGHYGLAAQYYTHFTSPIRRYPDLQIHRIIKEYLSGQLDTMRLKHYKEILPDIASLSSQAEKRAAEIERATIKYKECEYLQNHIGDKYDGIISSVTEYGFYVTLDNTIEGLVRAADLKDDYYDYIKEEYSLVGYRKKKRYRLGDKICISVEATDRLTGNIDFMVTG